MARDLTAAGVVGSALGVVPVLAIAGRGFSRTIIRTVGPVALRIARQTGVSVASAFHALARRLGYKIPRSAMVGVPRGMSPAATAAVATAAAAIKATRSAARTARGKLPKAPTKAPKTPRKR